MPMYFNRPRSYNTDEIGAKSVAIKTSGNENI
jgi:hypothetical protein